MKNTDYQSHITISNVGQIGIRSSEIVKTAGFKRQIKALKKLKLNGRSKCQRILRFKTCMFSNIDII